jgi:hypothetical protein
MTKKGNTQSKRTLIYGWGVNDSTEPVYQTEMFNGKRRNVWVCPYYSKWIGILERVLSERYHKVKPSYVGTTICEEWKYFTNFKKWVDEQPNRNWESCEPDKDILSFNGKHYSPETCVFISPRVNSFITDRKQKRGEYMLGVSWHKKSNKLAAQCCTYGENTSRHIGYFTNELEAHKAWQAKKHEYACMLADVQEDTRVADALRQRYAPDKDWTKA